jgi:hypothetical protein
MSPARINVTDFSVNYWSAELIQSPTPYVIISDFSVKLFLESLDRPLNYNSLYTFYLVVYILRTKYDASHS